jgi:predicted enzyme related to lactoylglutathione lyase
MITGVVGITLWTGDLDRLFRFYHETLGLPLHSNHGDYIALELGDVRFNIGLHDGVQGQARDPFRIMPHLGVADIHALHRSLSDEGVEFIRPPEKEGWGGWVATFKDPDGNIVQLLQFPAAGE